MICLPGPSGKLSLSAALAREIKKTAVRNFIADNKYREMLKRVRCLVLLLVLPLCCCERQSGTLAKIDVPLGLPPLASNRPVTVEQITLGKRLFFDTKLSSDNTISCASCHDPAKGFADGRKVSVGVGGKLGRRNAPTVLNAAYSRLQFWDGRAASLEEQAAGPIGNDLEMNQKHGMCVTKLSGDPNYVADFEKAFGRGEITMAKVQDALASYEKTLLSGNSAFDRYQYGGDKSALSPEAIRGFSLFGANCVSCHLITPSGALFTDGLFHNIGIGVNAEGELTDLGRYEKSKDEDDKGAFKTPSLRNVAKTGPYMHNGSLKSLREVVDFYVGGGNSNEHLDSRIKPLELSGKDREALIAFLESLTGEGVH